MFLRRGLVASVLAFSIASCTGIVLETGAPDAHSEDGARADAMGSDAPGNDAAGSEDGMPDPDAPIDYPAAIWHGDYASYSLEEIWGHQERTYEDRIRIVDDATQGMVARYEVRDGETAGITSNERVESADPETPPGSGTYWTGADGTDIWLGWRIMLDPAFDPGSGGGWCTLAQFKGWNPDTGSPPVAIGCRDGDLSVVMGSQDGYRTAWQGPALAGLRGSWHSMVLHVLFRTDSSGLVEVWMDGERQCNMSGDTCTYYAVTLHPNQGSGHYVYHKEGIYREASTFSGTAVLYVDDPRLGTSYEAVVPR